MKRSRITKRRSVSNLAESKFGLTSFRVLATFTVATISKR